MLEIMDESFESCNAIQNAAQYVSAKKMQWASPAVIIWLVSPELYAKR